MDFDTWRNRKEYRELGLYIDRVEYKGKFSWSIRIALWFFTLSWETTEANIN